MSIRQFKTYHLILIFIIFIELVFGSIFLYKYYQQIKYKKEQEQLKKITYIDKKNLVFPETREFKYYWKLQPNVVITDEPKWLNYKVTYTHNNDGLNERFDYAVEKPANTFRIITLGDSFTYGVNVNTEYNWTEQLEDILNNDQTNNHLKFEVINLGVYGFDIPYLIKRYRDIGAKYNPDLIIWFESGHGFSRLNEFEQPITQNCLKEYKDNNINVDNEAIHPCDIKTDQLVSMQSVNGITEEIIDKLNEFLSTLKSNEIVFFSYTKETMFSPELLEPSIEKIHNKHKDVKYLPIIKEEDINQTRLDDGHPDKFGHQLIAQTIYQYLKDNLLN